MKRISYQINNALFDRHTASYIPVDLTRHATDLVISDMVDRTIDPIDDLIKFGMCVSIDGHIYSTYNKRGQSREAH
jgi:hypothetical protein